jgi:hypothetical protein
LHAYFESFWTRSLATFREVAESSPEEQVKNHG